MSTLQQSSFGLRGPQSAVAEFQGLYGPFVCHERVLQKIWLRGDFNRAAARTLDGRSVEVIAPGNWNLLSGPDFLGAHLRLGDQELRGDIEVHFHASDWRAHSHRENPAFGSVILHVLLFPPDAVDPPALRADGSELPALVLLPLLLRDLEEHASDDALETLTARDEWRMIAELANLPPDELPALLRTHAEARWRQKIRFARLRIDKLGWTAAVHHVALEILGYRHNRAPMLSLASRWPLADWVAGLDPDAVFAGDCLNWNLQGLRPANHPRARLQQYAAIVRARPDWPERLVQVAQTGPSLPRPPTSVRAEASAPHQEPDFKSQISDFRPTAPPSSEVAQTAPSLHGLPADFRFQISDFRPASDEVAQTAPSLPRPPTSVRAGASAPHQEPDIKSQISDFRPTAPPPSEVAQTAPSLPGSPTSVRAGASAPHLFAAPSQIPTREARRALRLPQLRAALAREVLGDALAGPRLDNLVCDGFLPLLGAQCGTEAFDVWFHWYLGDAPDQVKRALPKLGVVGRREQPACHGYAQGLLGWLLDREARNSGWKPDE